MRRKVKNILLVVCPILAVATAYAGYLFAYVPLSRPHADIGTGDWDGAVVDDAFIVYEAKPAKGSFGESSNSAQVSFLISPPSGGYEVESAVVKTYHPGGYYFAKSDAGGLSSVGESFADGLKYGPGKAWISASFPRMASGMMRSSLAGLLAVSPSGGEVFLAAKNEETASYAGGQLFPGASISCSAQTYDVSLTKSVSFAIKSGNPNKLDVRGVVLSDGTKITSSGVKAGPSGQSADGSVSFSKASVSSSGDQLSLSFDASAIPSAGAVSVSSVAFLVGDSLEKYMYQLVLSVPVVKTADYGEVDGGILSQPTAFVGSSFCARFSYSGVPFLPWKLSLSHISDSGVKISETVKIAEAGQTDKNGRTFAYFYLPSDLLSSPGDKEYSIDWVANASGTKSFAGLAGKVSVRKPSVSFGTVSEIGSSSKVIFSIRLSDGTVWDPRTCLSAANSTVSWSVDGGTSGTSALTIENGAEGKMSFFVGEQSGTLRIAGLSIVPPATLPSGLTMSVGTGSGLDDTTVKLGV